VSTCTRVHSSVRHSALSCFPSYQFTITAASGAGVWLALKQKPSGEASEAASAAACASLALPEMSGKKDVGDQRR